jgi:hypothetical protein
VPQLGVHGRGKGSDRYGSHVAIEMAASLAERDIAVVSGGAYTTKSQLRAQRLSDLGRPVMTM